MSQAIRILPKEFTKEQHHRVGISAPDQWDRLWTYCMFPAGEYNAGELLRDTVASDIFGTFGSAEATVSQAVTEAAKAGTNTLQDTTANFTFDTHLRGAIGAIVEGAGHGQVFQVLRSQDNTLEIALISDDGAGSGWEVALETTSKYRLAFPGRVAKAWGSGGTGAGSDSISRGVIQADLTVPESEVRYGWMLQRGLGRGKTQGSAEALVTGTPVVPAPGGLLKASDLFLETDLAGLAIPEIDPADVLNSLLAIHTHARSVEIALLNSLKSIRRHAKTVGTAVLGNVRVNSSDTDDRLTPIYFDIRNTALSYRFPVKNEPYSKDDDGEVVL